MNKEPGEDEPKAEYENILQCDDISQIIFYKQRTKLICFA